MTKKFQDFQMLLQTLGRNGPIVSAHALGTMTFGAESDEPEAHQMLDLFAARGGTLIDTADVYSNGVSEEFIGNWAKSRGGADDMIIASKCRFLPTPGSHGASRRAIFHRVDASLKRLQMESIDLFFIHGWDKDTDVIETLRALGDLVTAGKIHHIGWSNLTGWQLERICRTAQSEGLPMPVALQPQYSLLDRGIEIEVLPCAIENGVGLTPWSPLGGGWLTGKYSSTSQPTGETRLGEDPNRGVEAYNSRNIERTYDILKVVSDISKKHKRPMAHVALACLSNRPGVTSILLGARTRDQLAGNLDAVDLVLTREEMKALTSVSSTKLPDYPYGFVRDWSGVNHWDKF